MAVTFLPYGRQFIDQDDIDAVVQALQADYLTTGPTVGEFERAFCAATGSTFAAACSNGTAALHLAALALDLGPGDVCVVPAVTFVATANCARFVGADVVFSDVDPETGLMRPQDLEAAIARIPERFPEGRLRAVLPVHLAGQTVPLAPIAEIARSHDAYVIEDACHALGTEYQTPEGWTQVGTCRDSDLACFSFHPVKTIALGEGGMITSSKPELQKKLAQLRSHGLTRDPDAFVNTEMAVDQAQAGVNPWYYEMQALGFNYRLTDIQAALGISQLRKLDWFKARRRALAARYDEVLAPLAPVVRPIAKAPGCNPVLHLYEVLVDFAQIGQTRGQVVKALAAKGIGTQVHYIPVQRQPYYEDQYGRQGLPGATGFYDRCLSLPLFPGMQDGDVERVVEALRDVIG
ncbi:UDP-4-amino-4,6-dideoxy-N-acetyl-beta-L-altrosamine transaminase [Inquilinus ginsengisoli]|uniref:UDP-4-amino-4, 6-dideoxy-N-acetyl-beta-L-altrosamine transaminase n=1 Tax=Inquilinus ginsengisoli TaxID=363840 RepID=A0ABU1JSR6_9PROT|nr:UDP-4-amino-4,6-dideoxy-N-acetyl-beta-L-altrosamine transaminase [Inquilinus ginsengisoli]MDR6291666.1 UDP-4-amino-4,6-dideoxy-N-acetyl-beta-L-altrosamine transaminase [Inquilinus ginsengisoli]